MTDLFELHAARVREDVERVGWHVTGVLATANSPSYSYTTGLYRTFSHPEFVVPMIDPRHAQQLFHLAIEQIRGGRRFSDGDVSDSLAQGYLIWFREVPDTYEVHFGVAERYYGIVPPYLQLVFPDVDGRFPDDPDCAPHIAKWQNLADPDWRFAEGESHG